MFRKLRGEKEVVGRGERRRAERNEGDTKDEEVIMLWYM